MLTLYIGLLSPVTDRPGNPFSVVQCKHTVLQNTSFIVSHLYLFSFTESFHICSVFSTNRYYLLLSLSSCFSCWLRPATTATLSCARTPPWPLTSTGWACSQCANTRREASLSSTPSWKLPPSDPPYWTLMPRTQTLTWAEGLILRIFPEEKRKRAGGCVCGWVGGCVRVCVHVCMRACVGMCVCVYMCVCFPSVFVSNGVQWFFWQNE